MNIETLSIIRNRPCIIAVPFTKNEFDKCAESEPFWRDVNNKYPKNNRFQCIKDLAGSFFLLYRKH